ncbi:hypothetical protein F9802_13105 [Bacillus aerolatus]|uniref:Uncharacterized protein n=1 Tax=Bacillus aerolatus TaxID=2653354 RepID=A0A6I1FE70_9BACI|nr:hypothetical protein [Bacillus aerolatus]KAB7705997.1 hypothetical protein F9802_13105 [Bacillus aerolatus]
MVKKLKNHRIVEPLLMKQVYVQLQLLAPRGQITFPKESQRATFFGKEHLLVGADQGACAFVVVQLQRLAPRGQITFPKESQRATFFGKEHLLVGADQGAYAFV